MTFRPHALHLKAELFVKSSRVHVRDDGFTRCNFHLKFFIMVSRGIDISKSSFVAAYPSTNGNPTKTFPNTTARMRELIGTLAVAEHHCVMEATSNYGCCCTCYIRTVLPSVLPPPKKQIKHFSRMMMPVTKTDEKDAYMIAMYGACRCSTVRITIILTMVQPTALEVGPIFWFMPGSSMLESS